FVLKDTLYGRLSKSPPRFLVFDPIWRTALTTPPPASTSAGNKQNSSVVVRPLKDTIGQCISCTSRPLPDFVSPNEDTIVLVAMVMKPSQILGNKTDEVGCDCKNNRS